MPKTKEPQSDVLIETIKLTDNTKLTVHCITFDEDGSDVMINLRKWYKTKADPTWKPAKQGITVPLDKAAKLRVKIKKVAEAASEDKETIEYVKKGKSND